MDSSGHSACFFLIITGPQRSWAKVIFSQACVKNSVHGGGGGCLPQCMLGYTPPDQADPPGPGRPSPGPGRPPRTRQTPLGSKLQHTVYERSVRILLECILVDKRKRSLSVSCSVADLHRCQPSVSLLPADYFFHGILGDVNQNILWFRSKLKRCPSPPLEEPWLCS